MRHLYTVVLFLCWQLLTYAINGALELFDVSDDVYCLGNTSGVIATELASLAVAKHRRKVKSADYVNDYKSLTDEDNITCSTCTHLTLD